MLRKRMTVSECADVANEYYICEPLSNETWYQGDDNHFIWKNKSPYFIASGPDSDLSTSQIDIHLYYRENYAYQYIKNWTNLSLVSGELDVTVTDEWFPTPSGTNKTWTMYGYILPSGTNATAELTNTLSQFPRPFNFSVVQLGDGVTTSDNGSRGTGKDGTSSSDSDHLPGWAIAVIVIAVLALVAVVGLILWGIWFFRKRKAASQQQQQQQQQQKLQPQLAMMQQSKEAKGLDSPGSESQRAFRAPVYDGASIHSSTPIVGRGAAPGSARDSATTDASSGSRSLPSPPADSFRNLLQHYPDWKSATTTPGAHEPAPEDTEAQRRRLGEALLQRELEEEGAAVKHTDHRPLPIQTVAPPSQPLHESTAVVLERSPSTTTSS